MSVEVKLDATEVLENLKKIGANVESRVGAALFGIGHKVRLDSMNRTPVDTGSLKSSHTVTRPERRGDRIQVTIGAGGASADYAVYVHEDLSARHVTGQAKFLERAIVEAAASFVADLMRYSLIGR